MKWTELNAHTYTNTSECACVRAYVQAIVNPTMNHFRLYLFRRKRKKKRTRMLVEYMVSYGFLIVSNLKISVNGYKYPASLWRYASKPFAYFYRNNYYAHMYGYEVSNFIEWMPPGLKMICRSLLCVWRKLLKFMNESDATCSFTAMWHTISFYESIWSFSLWNCGLVSYYQSVHLVPKWQCVCVHTPIKHHSRLIYASFVLITLLFCSLHVSSLETHWLLYYYYSATTL